MSIALLMGEPSLCDDDADAKRELIARLSAAYQINYADESSLNFQGAKDLFRRAVLKGWTASEFFQRLDAMTETCRFITWTPADFFASEREQLHNRAWAMTEHARDNQAMRRMDVYTIAGTSWYRYHDGRRFDIPNAVLTMWCGKAVPGTLDDAHEESVDVSINRSRETREEISWMNRYFAAQNELSESHETIQRLRRELAALRRDVQRVYEHEDEL
jgi:hypothetical protein